MSTAKPDEAGEAGRLSRRDRAAMTLGLHLLRLGVNVAHVRNTVLCWGRPVSLGVALDAADATGYVPERILRARLALALRVLLRASSDDNVRGRCRRQTRGERCTCWQWQAPLWESAPPHAAATGDRRDDSAARAAGGER